MQVLLGDPPDALERDPRALLLHERMVGIVEDDLRPEREVGGDDVDGEPSRVGIAGGELASQPK